VLGDKKAAGGGRRALFYGKKMDGKKNGNEEVQRSQTRRYSRLTPFYSLPIPFAFLPLCQPENSHTKARRIERGGAL
jgi:hypothetical protein